MQDNVSQQGNLITMKEQRTPSLKDWKIFFLSYAGLGFAPKAPGTVASAATLPLLWALGHFPLTPLGGFFILILSIGLTSYIADLAQEQYRCHDPSWIVVDEVLGMFTTWLLFRPSTSVEWLGLFLFFRFFDIVKVWPASYFDKKIVRGYGTILDDIVSGIYAGFCLILLKIVLPGA